MQCPLNILILALDFEYLFSYQSQAVEPNIWLSHLIDQENVAQNQSTLLTKQIKPLRNTYPS